MCFLDALPRDNCVKKKLLKNLEEKRLLKELPVNFSLKAPPGGKGSQGCRLSKVP